MDISSIIVLALAVLGSWATLCLLSWSGLAILVVCIIWLTVVVLFFWGTIGPRAAREKMSRLNTFLNYDSTVLPMLQYDITKSPEENRRLAGTAPPLRERLKNAGRVIGVLWPVQIVIVTLGILILWFIVRFLSAPGH